MSETDQMQRNEPYRRETYRTEPGRIDLVPNDGGLRGPEMREPAPRAVGSPLPIGSSQRTPQIPGEPIRNVPPPGRALSAPAQPEADSAVQWARGLFKQAMPFVQRLLPLIDGNIATAVANLLTPHPHPPPPPQPPVDLAPIETGMAELRTQQSDLRSQVMEQNSTLKRVEDQLEMVREATDRNTLEQQELIEDLKSVGNKVNVLGLLLIALLVISVLLNLVLFLHIQRVLP